MPQQSEASSQLIQGYRPKLDWLRFFAFLAVFVHHSFPHDAESYTSHFHPTLAGVFASIAKSFGFGVDLFFTLSAFLITNLLLNEHAKFGRIDIGAFYLRRLLRIWPLYFVFLALAWLVFKPALDGIPLLFFTLFLANWYCVYFHYPNTVADPLWSVSIEEQFYLAWPPLLVFFGIRRLPQLIVSFLVISWATRAVAVYYELRHPAIWCNTFARLDPIAMGIAIALYQRYLPDYGRGMRATLILMGIVAIVACGYSDAFFGFSSLFVFPIVALACSLILLGFLDCQAPNTETRSRILNLCAYLGKISYGLYVFHMLALTIVVELGFGKFLKPIIGLPITIVLAVLSYEFLEAPFLRLKNRYTRVPSRPE